MYIFYIYKIYISHRRHRKALPVKRRLHSVFYLHGKQKMFLKEEIGYFPDNMDLVGYQY